MASDGKIIIDTKLDTSGFEKDVDNASKKIVGSMGNVEKSMKKATASFDGSKMANQLNNVSKSIDNTNKKLDLETQKLAKLKEAYSNAMNPAQQNKLQEQIVNTESKITSLEGKLNGLKDKQINLTTKVNTESIDKAVDSINKTGSKISSVGNSLSTKVTLPIVAAAAASGKFAADFEHQMADIQKEVKAKGEDYQTVMAQMSSSSIKWSEDYGQSTDDINKGLLILVKDGYSGAESMNIMNTALKTARGANEDLFTTIDKLGGSLEAYQMKSDNAATTTSNMAKMADTFAYISNHTKASIDSLGEAFSTVGQTASALGQPMEQTAAAIGILESSNIDANTAATSLKAGLVNLTKPTKLMQKGMKELSLTAFDGNGNMKDFATIIDDVGKGSKNLTTQQKEAAIAMVFGKESLASWTTLVNKGGDYLRNLSTSAASATGEVQELSDSMANTPVNKMKEFEASAKALGITFGEDVLPALTPIINDLTGMLKSFADLDEGTKKQIIDFALMAAATGPVLKVIGSLTGGIGSLVKFGGKLATTMGLIGEGAEVGGVALTGFSVAGMAAAGVATALVAGVAGVITYNELLGRSVNTSTDDLNTWEKVVNDLTGGTIKSKEELQKAGLVYKDFGDGVSKSFKNGIEQATKSYHDFEMELTKDNMGDKISVGDQGKLTDSINKMIDGAKSAINKRKGEIQGELSDVFTADGSGIDANEQKVLDISTQGADEKLAKISEIQGKISEVWDKAIAQHGKLSEEDIATIKNYLVQVQQIKAEVEAKNDAESSFAKNNFAERLNGISAEDASKEYTDASKTVKDNFVKLKATYKTGIDDLNKMQKEAEESGTPEQVEAIKKQIEEKTKAYKDATGEEQSQIREYLNMLYAKNPSLEGNMNEITGEMFDTHDKNAQADLYNIKKKYQEVANATEDGIKHVKDASGNWHDIYVTVDQETGKITTAFDTFDGEFGGYSKKFEDQARTMSQQVNAQVRELAKDIASMPTNLKIDADNNIDKIDTGETISKLNTVITKADETKVAIENINGVQVKLEFDKDGTLKNADDVKKAVVDKVADSPAIVNIDVNDQDALNKFTETENKADELSSKTPNVNATANTNEADTNLDTTSKKVEDLNGKEADTTVKVNTGNSLTLLDDIKSGLSWLSGKVFGATVKISQAAIDYGNADGARFTQDNYTGTNYLRTGLSHVNEHGYETAKNTNVKMLDSGLAFLIGHHYTGGDGINDHMTTVNEMHNDISNQVGNTVGKVINTLISSLGGQSSLLKQIVSTGEKSNKLNEDLAKNIVSQYKNSSTGTFSNLENEITSANSAKDKADKMKVEDNYWYSSTKAQYDDLEKQLKDIENENTKLNSQKQESFDKSTSKEVANYNKTIELQTKENESKKAALEEQKNSLQDSVDYYKDAAQKEIDTCKETAEQEVKVAEEKKDKLTKLAEAVTTAIKNQYESEKKSAEDALNNDLKSMETSYNNSIKSLEDKYKSKSDAIDKKLKDLEEETTETSRDDERKTSNDSISALETKISNTADEADKRKFQLELEKAREELNKKEDSWDVEDQKAELEAEKEKLSERETAEKESLEKSYNSKKEAKEQELQDTDKYYDKLLEEDSVNAKARYMLLQGNQNDLVTLLQTYNPLWQDAGQSLADSLLTGLNSQKQSIQDAVAEMINLKGSNTTSTTSSDSYYYDGKGQKVSYSTGKVITGYSSGTDYNQAEGLYYTNEDGSEMSTNGDVAYVSKGASIKNRMQTDKFISSEIASQVALMKSAVIQSQMDIARSLGGLISKTTNTNNNVSKVYQPILQIKEYHQHTNQDAEQLANEFGVIAYKQKVD